MTSFLTKARALYRVNSRNPNFAATVLILTSIALCITYLGATYLSFSTLRRVALPTDPSSPLESQLEYAIETFAIDGGSVMVRGWIALAGTTRAKFNSKLIIYNESTGVAYIAKSRAVKRPDVTSHLNTKLGTSISYDNSGFVASLPVDDKLFAGSNTLYIAFDDGTHHALLRTASTLVVNR